MFYNWSITALRQMLRQGFYSGVKLFGLGIGIAAAIVAMLLVRDDLSYDNFFRQPELLYRISSISAQNGLSPSHYALTPGDLATWLNLEYPDEIEATRLDADSFPIQYGNVETTQAGYSADKNLFEILDLKFASGDSHHALDEPNSIVLTKSKAQTIFGTANAMGLQFQIINGNNHSSVRVTGILEDLPNNTHLDAQIILSRQTAFSSLHSLEEVTLPPNALNISVQTYIRAKMNITRARLDAILTEVVAKHYPSDHLGGSELRFSPDLISAIHLDPDGLSGRHGSDVSTVFGIGAVGVLLLIIAIINFSNLVTAEASTRFIEIGVRRSVGAARWHIAGQLFFESMVFSLFGLILGLGFVEVSLPTLNAILDRTLSLDYLHDGFLAEITVGLLVSVGIVGGAYPAWSLSLIRPSLALKRGKNLSMNRPSLVQGLVILQFSIGIGMIIATAMIYEQVVFATNAALKFDKDQVLVVVTHLGCTDSFKQELRSRRGIVAAACSWSAPLSNRSTSSVKLPDGRELTAARQPVDFGFFDLYHLPLVAGRDFSKDHLATDQAPVDTSVPLAVSVVINETAARYFGFKTPEAAVGRTISIHRISEDSVRDRAGESTIIGVVTDFPVESVRLPILPTVFYVDPSIFQMLSVKLKQDDILAGVASVDAVWRAFGPDQLIERFFLDAKIRERYEALLTEQKIFLTLSGLGILVACIGLFGLAGYVAQARTKEIGVRKALGATTQQLVGLLVWQFIKPVVAANLIAWPLAGWILRSWLDGFALRVELDPAVFFGAGALAVTVAILVTAGHAIKLARSRPIEALRYE